MLARPLGFFDKPSWYGTPILVKPNARRYFGVLIVVIVASVIVGAVATILIPAPQGETVQKFLTVSVAFGGIILTLAGVLLCVFFFTRGFVNTLRMYSHRADSARWLSLDGVFQPFFGWRDRDLTETGLHYRRLALEGWIGYVVSFLMIVACGQAMRLVGLDIQG